MRKIVLTFGLIAGAVLSAMLLITLPFKDQIGFDQGAVIGYTSMVLAFLMVYFGVRSYRDSVDGGQLTFGRAFLVGLAITFLEPLPVGLVFTLVTAGVLGRKPRPIG